MSELNRKVAVVTDGTSSLTPAMGQRYGIHVMPIYVTFENRTYIDGVNLDADTFYRLLRDSTHLPTTAQPSVQDFMQAYAVLSGQVEAIISVHASHKMSGTLDSALAASRQLLGIPIHVIDSRSISMGLGLMAMAAARAAAAGQNTVEVVRLVEELIPKMNVIFTVETLEYLHKGGRIGGASALLGTALKIKPVLHLRDGQIEPLEKTRSKKRATGRLLHLMAERIGASEAVHAAVLHCNESDEAQLLADQISEQFSCVSLLIVEAGPIIGTHAGPGTLGVAFHTT